MESLQSDAHLISRWMSRFFKTSTFAPVAQLDRASACGAEGHTFESCRVYQIKRRPKGSYFYLVNLAGENV